MPEIDKKSSTTLTYHDPGKTFDGTPYEASGKAVDQTQNVLKLLRKAVLDTRIQVRNAWLQRNLDTTGTANAQAWADSPEEKLLRTFLAAIDKMQTKLTALHRATTYDPKNPDKE